MNIAEFGNYLKRLRTDRGFTLTALAKESGVSHPYLSQIENGKLNKVPSPEIIKKLAKALGHTYAHLMLEAGHITEEEFWDYTEDDIAALKAKILESEKKSVDYKTAVIGVDFFNLAHVIKSPQIWYDGVFLNEDDKASIINHVEFLLRDRLKEIRSGNGPEESSSYNQ